MKGGRRRTRRRRGRRKGGGRLCGGMRNGGTASLRLCVHHAPRGGRSAAAGTPERTRVDVLVRMQSKSLRVSSAVSPSHWRAWENARRSKVPRASAAEKTRCVATWTACPATPARSATASMHSCSACCCGARKGAPGSARRTLAAYQSAKTLTSRSSSVATPESVKARAAVWRATASASGPPPAPLSLFSEKTNRKTARRYACAASYDTASPSPRTSSASRTRARAEPRQRILRPTTSSALFNPACAASRAS
mmetsp:Transcript_14205/g.47437  ORF Transcript_14205/g.47437 Transcript_14205/m.47437 type:complete len:252 (+) Transcript_14205:127-882(+)